MEKIGLLYPILIDKENYIISGLYGLLACKELGFKEISCGISDKTFIIVRKFIKKKTTEKKS